MIRVLLVDDQPLIRSGLRALLELEDDITVVGEAADGAAGLALISERRPDIALVDVQMPGMDGLELARRVAADPSLGSVHLVMLTNYGVDEYVYEALRAGAAGFLVKDVDPDELVHGLRVVARGDALLAPAVTRMLVDRFVSMRPRPGAIDALTRLTAREGEVVALVARGLTNDEIADRLVISPLTVKTHVNRAMFKLGARDRAQLVVVAYSGGVTPVNASSPLRSDGPHR